MSHLQTLLPSPIHNVEIRIHDNTDAADDSHAFCRVLTVAEQSTVLLRELLQTYCAERRVSAASYSLALHHDILPAAATMATVATEYNIPRCRFCKISLTAVLLKQPDAACEGVCGRNRMSHTSLHDTHIAHTVINRDGVLMDLPCLAELVFDTEKAVGPARYRLLHETDRHQRIVSALKTYFDKENATHTPTEEAMGACC